MNIRATRNKRRAASDGFTLMELMVVVAIIAILAAIVLPNMLGTLDDTNVTAAKAQIKSFQTSLVAYKVKNKKFPTTGEGLNALVGAGLMDTLPKDPWGNDYVYRSPGTKNKDYEIISYGSDGQPGGSDYAADIESWNLQ